MTDYNRTSNFFGDKDNLLTGNANKIIKGAEFDTEFNNIEAAMDARAKLASPTFSGIVTIPIAEVTTLNIGGTAVTATAVELNKLTGVNTTTAELNFVAGVTSNIQTQLDSKLSSGTLSFADNEKAQFGAGNDLQIYHDGSNSIVEDAGTGNLNIKSNNNGVIIQDSNGDSIIAGLGVTGEAKLFHVTGSTSTQRLVTTNSGVEIDGDITVNNTGIAIFSGTSALASASPFVDVKSDGPVGATSTTVAVIRGPGTSSAAVARTAGLSLKISNETSQTESEKGYDIYTTSSSTFGNNPSFHIDYADGTKRFSAADSGESYLYYNDSEKLATSTSGVSVTGVTDTDQLRVTTPTVPSSASDTGTAGDIAWDSGYIYVCTATNTWKRVALNETSW
jgi:hypothetical protein